MIREYASQFNILIFTQEIDMSVSVQHLLKQSKYQVELCADFQLLFQEIENKIPHVLLLDLKYIQLELSDLLQSILKISEEIKVIIIGESEHLKKLEKYQKLNVSLMLDRTSVSLDVQTLFAVDSVCENLFRLFQNEELFKKVKEYKVESEKFELKNKEELSSYKVKSYQNRISFYKQAQSKEEVLDVFYQHTPEQSWMYLKFADTIKTFVCVSYSNVPEKWIEGLSFKISKDENEFINQIIRGELPKTFEKYLEDKLSLTQFKFIPFIFNEKIEGILLSPQNIEANTFEDFSLMSLVYELKFAKPALKTFDVEDELTGLYTQDYFNKILDREVDRAKRSLKPLSLIKISIDRFSELEQTQGSDKMHQLIKSISEVIKNETRLSDFVCRTDVNEFSLILTHCTRKGAALRAERLKQIFLNQEFKLGSYKVTFSQGICEYPSLASDALELNLSAKKALEFIADKGGDRICMSKAPQQHKPDFSVEV